MNEGGLGWGMVQMQPRAGIRGEEAAGFFRGLQAAPTLTRHTDAPCLLSAQVEQLVWGFRFPREGPEGGWFSGVQRKQKLMRACAGLRWIQLLGLDLPLIF